MHEPPRLETERLRLRTWRDDDLAPFAAINADPRVARYLPAPLTADESDAMAARIRDHFAAHGYGLFAAELRENDTFIGFIGLSIPRFEAHFTPCVEIGWRLAHASWGHGLATEGAAAALAYGFEELGLLEIVSFTVPANRGSWRVMQKIGLELEGEFEHPALPLGHRLRRHVLYRLSRETFQARLA